MKADLISNSDIIRFKGERMKCTSALLEYLEGLKNVKYEYLMVYSECNIYFIIRGFIAFKSVTSYTAEGYVVFPICYFRY